VNKRKSKGRRIEDKIPNSCPFGLEPCAVSLAPHYINFSKRSWVALQIGQISGGDSRAQRYPQTLHRQRG